MGNVKDILDFFDKDKSKMLSLVPEKYIKAYKRLYIFLREKLDKGEIVSSNNYLNNSLLAKNIYKTNII